MWVAMQLSSQLLAMLKQFSDRPELSISLPPAAAGKCGFCSTTLMSFLNSGLVQGTDSHPLE